MSWTESGKNFHGLGCMGWVTNFGLGLNMDPRPPLCSVFYSHGSLLVRAVFTFFL